MDRERLFTALIANSNTKLLKHLHQHASRGAAAALAFPLVGGAQPKAVKVGILHPVTGALAFSGQQCREGALMAIEDINKAGGINGTFVIGVELYMTQDYSIYIEAGVNAPFIRDLLAPQLTGGLVGIGARTFF